MVSISGEVNISLTKEELEVLLSVIEGAITDCYYEGDDPSEASGQGSLLRGGDSFDPSWMRIEMPHEKVERIRPLDLDSGRSQK